METRESIYVEKMFEGEFHENVINLTEFLLYSDVQDKSKAILYRHLIVNNVNKWI